MVDTIVFPKSLKIFLFKLSTIC